MLPALTKSRGLAWIPSLLALAGLLAPAGAAAKPTALTIPVPAPGKIAVLTADVTAVKSNSAPAIKVGATVPRSVSKTLGVIAETSVSGRTKRLRIYVLNRKSSTARAAKGETVTVNVDGVGKAISVANVQKAKDGLAKLTPAQRTEICDAGKGGKSVVKTLFGLKGANAGQLARAIAAAICGTANAGQVKLLQDLGIVVPAVTPQQPQGKVACQAFQGNANEASCTYTGDVVNRVRVQATRGDTFSQCFTPLDGGSCQANGAEIVFTFANPTGSAPLNLRFGNTTYANGNPIIFFVSDDGGQSFGQCCQFDPP